MYDSVTIGFVVVAGIALTWTHAGLLCAFLRRAHRVAWVRLGEPATWTCSLPAFGRLLKFIWLDHAGIDDVRLRAYVVSGQILQVLALGLVFALVVANWRMGVA